MKAIVYEEYGSSEVLQLREVEKPIPKDDEVLVQVHAVSINYIDWQVLTGESFFLRLTTGGIRKPKHMILGDDVAGKVEAVGSCVKLFKPGDEVFGISNFGGFAEYSCVKEELLTIKPVNMSFEQAAAIPTAAIPALLGLRDKGQIQFGQKVLINGASGGVGTFAVQIAKSFGAEVTGVCSTRKMDTVRSIGADHVIDYTQEDFTKGDKLYDLILAASGNLSVFDYQRVITSTGSYVCVGGSMRQYFQAMLIGPIISRMGSKKIGTVFAPPTQDDFNFLKGLFEAGKLIPVIDKCFPLSDVPDALQYYGDGNAVGKVVITLEPR